MVVHQRWVGEKERERGRKVIDQIGQFDRIWGLPVVICVIGLHNPGFTVEIIDLCAQTHMRILSSLLEIFMHFCQHLDVGLNF